MMIRSICIGIFLWMGTFSLLKAQKPFFKPQSHEVSLQLIGVNAIPALSDGYDGTPFSISPVNGLAYAYHLDLYNGFRLGVQRRRARFSYPQGVDRFAAYQAEKTDWDIRLAYLRKYHAGVWQFYGGIQGLFSPGKVTDNGTLNNANRDPFQGTYTYRNWGGSVLGGVRLFFNQSISAGLETDVYYLRTRHEPGNEDVFLLLPEQEWGINLSLYLSFHFVEMPKRCACPKVRR